MDQLRVPQARAGTERQNVEESEMAQSRRTMVRMPNHPRGCRWAPVRARVVLHSTPGCAFGSMVRTEPDPRHGWYYTHCLLFRSSLSVLVISLWCTFIQVVWNSSGTCALTAV